ncbi:MAG: serine protease [Actinomycetota bacterium]
MAAVAGSLLVAGTPATAAVKPSDANRSVINGSMVPRPSLTVPWAVSLFHSDHPESDRFFTCTATALGPLEVLTAAHCVTEPGFYYVLIGADSLNRGHLVAIEAIDVHGGYRSTTTKDDVAVLRPLQRLNLKSYAQLATPTMAASVRTSSTPPTLTLYGWGRNEQGALTGRLNQADLIRQRSLAKSAYPGAFIDGTMLAAGGYNPRTRLSSGGCHGDSGGPLIVHNNGIPYVVGVVSYGEKSCDTGSPTVFTSVGNYSAWIATSRRGLPAMAIRRNRAVPELRTAPVISGTVAAGATLTCAAGMWTGNARKFSYNWSRQGGSTSVGTGPQYIVSQQDSGAQLVCTVTATSVVGDAKAFARVTAGLAPEPVVGQWTTISGVTDYVQPLPDTIATCNAPAFLPTGVTITQGWFSGLSADPISTGSTLLLSKELLIQLGGQQLTCRTTAVNTMGTNMTEGRVQLPPLYAPTVSASVATVPIAAGSIATCLGAGSRVGEVVTYEWALEPAFTNNTAFSGAAQPLGVGQTYTLTDADVVGLGTAQLACRATVTAWYAAVSDVAVMAP